MCSINTSDYTYVKVDFWFYAHDINVGEGSRLQFYDGSSWQDIEIYIVGTDFDNGSFENKTEIIYATSYNFPVDMKLRFMANTGSFDYFYLDYITVSAE